jgi:hypothetical protein
VRLTLARQRRPGTLPQVRSADGRYAYGAMEFRIEGNAARLTRAGAATECRTQQGLHRLKTPLWELEGSIKESLMAARIPNIYHGNLLTRRSVIGTDVSSICMPAYRESDAGAPFAVSDWTSGGRSIARWRLTRDIGVLSPFRTCRVHARLLRRCYSPSHWRRPQRGQMRRRAIS